MKLLEAKRNSQDIVMYMNGSVTSDQPEPESDINEGRRTVHRDTGNGATSSLTTEVEVITGNGATSSLTTQVGVVTGNGATSSLTTEVGVITGNGATSSLTTSSGGHICSSVAGV